MLLALVLALPPPVAVGPGDVKKISRIEAIHLGVTRNYDLLSRRLEQRRVEVLGRAAWKPYSPTVFVDASYRQTAGRRLVAELDALG